MMATFFPGTNEKPNTENSVLGFDFGTVRMGVAFGQRMLGTICPLSPLKAKEGIPNWDEITKLVDEWQPEVFVIGLPLHLDGTENEMCYRARKFAKRLYGRFNLPYHMVDERLSSFEAKRQVISCGGNRNFKENSVDGLAARMIVETWFVESN